jgi:hypothetical protein
MLPIVGRFANRGGLSIELITTGSRGLEEYDVADLAERTRLIHGCPVTSRVIEGSQPAADLADYVHSLPGALLCLASHGRTVIGDLLLGSMTEELLRRHVGLMLAIGPDVPDDYQLDDTLIVAIDEESVQTSILDAAASWQATFGGEVELFEAVTRDSINVDVSPTDELRAANARLTEQVTDKDSALTHLRERHRQLVTDVRAAVKSSKGKALSKKLDRILARDSVLERAEAPTALTTQSPDAGTRRR